MQWATYLEFQLKQQSLEKVSVKSHDDCNVYICNVYTGVIFYMCLLFTVAY